MSATEDPLQPEAEDLREINHLMEDPDLRPIIERFTRNLPGYVNRIKDALSARDRSGLQSYGHELKGTAASFGLAKISAAASLLEKRAPSSPEPELREQVETLENLTVDALSRIKVAANAI